MPHIVAEPSPPPPLVVSPADRAPALPSITARIALRPATTKVAAAVDVEHSGATNRTFKHAVIRRDSQRGAISSAQESRSRLPMSHLLWKYYWENDVDRFRRLLDPGALGSHAVSKSPAIGAGGVHLGASPGGLGKSRRALGLASAYGGAGLSRSEVNSRDHAGLSILLRAASSTGPNACDFVQALVEHPSIDLYAQDPESGWNALHRSLYSGNISIARLLLAKERSHLTNRALQSIAKVGQLIKTKDHEGNSPFDVYNSTIATRAITKSQEPRISDSGSESSDTEEEATQMFVSPPALPSRPSCSRPSDQAVAPPEFPTASSTRSKAASCTYLGATEISLSALEMKTIVNFPSVSCFSDRTSSYTASMSRTSNIRP